MERLGRIAVSPVCIRRCVEFACIKNKLGCVQIMVLLFLFGKHAWIASGIDQCIYASFPFCFHFLWRETWWQAFHEYLASFVQLIFSNGKKCGVAFQLWYYYTMLCPVFTWTAAKATSVRSLLLKMPLPHMQPSAQTKTLHSRLWPLPQPMLRRGRAYSLGT